MGVKKIERFPTRTGIPNMEFFDKGVAKLPEVLSRMGYSGLRAGQDKAIMNLLAGMDTLCILPTGAGKSSVFTIPTLCHEMKTIVVSPLVALMRDQVKGLWANGIPAGQISSTQTEGENIEVMKGWVDGKIDILYVAPERFANKMFAAAIKSRKPDFIAIDECHILSETCDNFRPAYKLLGDIIREIDPQIIGAFTATCTADAEQDVRNILGMQKADKIFYYPRRENLKLSSAYLDNELQLLNYLKKTKGCTVVYFSTIKRVEELRHVAQDFLQEPITYYHGELSAEVKRTNQDLFMDDKIRIMFATNAFGTGINKGNIRNVIVRDIPQDIATLTQLLGRGGRDGKESKCHAFLADDSVRTQEFFLRNKYPPMEEVAAFFSQMEACADSNGMVEATINSIARKSGINQFSCDAIYSLLIADNVIKRAADKSPMGCVKVFKIPPDNNRLQDWYDIIQEGGFANKDGSIEVDMDWLADKLGYNSQSQVRKWLKLWERDNLISFRPPPSKAPLEIIGGLDRIDFPRLQEKAKLSKAGLQEVIDYFEIDDADKHTYLEKKFKEKYS